MKRFLKISLIVILPLAAGALIWLAIEKQFFQRYILQPYQSELTLDVSLKKMDYRSIPTDKGDVVVYEQHIKVSGTTSLPAHIKLLLNDNTAAEVDADQMYFEFDPVTLRPGANTLSIEAEAIVNWRKVSKFERVDLRYEPIKPSSPILLAAAATVAEPKVEINGLADPSIDVSITLEKLSDKPRADSEPQPSPAASPEATALAVRADDDGRFQGVISLPEEGDYKIGAHALNGELQVSDSSNFLQVKYDKGFYPKLEPIKRSTTISIDYRQTKVELEATLPKDDPRVTGLLSGNVTAPEFIDKVFGYLIINNTYLLADFPPETVPVYALHDKTTTVKLVSSPTSGSNDSLPAFRGTIEIRTSSLKAGPNDSLQLRVRGYNLHSVSPQPSMLSGDDATWLQGDAELALNNGVKAELRSDVADHPLRLFQLTPLAIPYSWVVVLCNLVRELFPLIPVIWFLWLLKKEKSKLGSDANWTSDYENVPQRLMVWMLIPVVMGPAMALANGLEKLVPDGSLGIFKYYFPELLGVGGATLLFLAIFLWFRRSKGGFWLWLLSKRLFQAWLIVAVFFGIMFAMERLGFYAYGILTVAILGPALILFLKDATRWTKTMFIADDEIAVAELGRWARLVLLFSLLLVFPTSNVYFQIYNPEPWVRFQAVFTEFFYHLRDLAPYVLLPVVFVVLRRFEQRVAKPGDATAEFDDLLILSLGTLIFSSYLVGLDPSLFWFPVPFALALYLFKRMVVLDPDRRKIINAALPEVLSARGAVIRALKGHANPKQLQDALGKLEKKFNSADISFDDYQKRKKQIEDFLEKDDAQWPVIGKVKAKDVVLSVGPSSSNWGNGCQALKQSVYLVVPLLLLYTFVFLLKDIRPYYSLFYLWFFTRLMVFAVDAFVGAFFFGFFFNSIRGSSGLKKGITISVAIILCLLPSWIAPLSSSSVTNLFALLFRAGQTFLFFTFLGVFAFDYKNYREAVKEEFQWKKFARFGDMPSATTFLSVTLTSIGVTLTTVLTGQFTSIVTQIIKTALPSVPIPPGK